MLNLKMDKNILEIVKKKEKIRSCNPGIIIIIPDKALDKFFIHKFIVIEEK